MEKISDYDLLKIANESGMIDLNTIREKIEMNERKKYLEMHNSKIWQSTDKKWYTFVPDCTKKNGRKLVKRKTKKQIEDCIIEHYREEEKPHTIKATFDEWLERKIKFGEIEKQTADRYIIDFNKYFSECEDKNIQYVDEDFFDNLILNNIKKYNLKQKAWGNMKLILRGIFLYAKKKGYCRFNVTEYLQELTLSQKLFNHERKPRENVIFTDLEIKTILDNVHDSKNINDIAIMFAIYTGMRVGEIVALRWEDVGDNYINVRRTQVRYKDETGKNIYEVRNFPKTEAGIREVVIVPELKELIKRLRIINPFTEYLFEKNKKSIPEHSVSTRLYYLCNKFNFPTKGMHSLRRYYATKLINAGVEEVIITSQMGHSDFTTTKTYYYRNNKNKEYTYNQILQAIQ